MALQGHHRRVERVVRFQCTASHRDAGRQTLAASLNIEIN
jgi:hypothetical protein